MVAEAGKKSGDDDDSWPNAGKRWKYTRKQGYLDQKQTGWLGFGGWKRKLFMAEGPKFTYLDDNGKSKTIDLREHTVSWTE